MTMTRPTTEQITHNGQILKDVLGPVYNIMSFGAKGDGVTNDLPALQAAVAQAVAAGGGTVFIPRTSAGYFLQIGSCDLSGSSGISIVSDGADLKCIGAPNQSTGVTNALFVGSNVSHLTVRGLTFSVTSTVLRYGNGDADFDTAVNQGQASATAQTSFRSMMNISGGTCENIAVDDCTFMPGWYFGMTVKTTLASGAKNVRYTNLRFISVNHVCMQAGGADNVIIENIVCEGGQDSRFDHIFYFGNLLANVTISNVQSRNNNGVAFAVNRGVQRVQMTNLLFENITNASILCNGGCSDVTITNVVFKNSGDPAKDSSNFGNGSLCTNVTLSSVVWDSCPWYPFVIGDNSKNAECKNVRISNFIIKSCTVAGKLWSGVGLVIENGVIMDSQASGNFCLTNGATGGSEAPTVASDATIRNVDFVYTTGNPPTTVMPLTGALWNITLDNVSFRRLGGATAISPVFANGSVINVRNCRLDGFTNSLVNTSSSGSVGEIVEAQPLETVLTANSATPSVASARLFVTANTSATAYTNFTDGVNGQEICIRVNDANTTFDFTGTSLKGRNGVDYTATSGDVIFAKRIGSNWYCTVVEA